MKFLIRDEEGLKDIGVDAAREFQQVLLEMGSISSCEELHKDANELGVELLWKYDGLQKEFDADERRQYYERGLAFP